MATRRSPSTAAQPAAEQTETAAAEPAAEAEPATAEPVAPPTNVVAALARVQAEIGGIAKLSPEDHRRRRGAGGDGERGISYAYRGIDQIAAAAQPLFGRFGIVIVPTVSVRDTVEIIVNNKPWTDTFVHVHWDIYGPGGLEDRIVARTEGWGRDNSDKGINKAMTGAYKNLLLRLLCIGDPADDTDGHTHEADAAPAAPDPEFEARRERAVQCFEEIKALPDELRAAVRDWARGHEWTLTVPVMAESEEILAAVESWLDEHKPQPPATAAEAELEPEADDWSAEPDPVGDEQVDDPDPEPADDVETGPEDAEQESLLPDEPAS